MFQWGISSLPSVQLYMQFTYTDTSSVFTKSCITLVMNDSLVTVNAALFCYCLYGYNAKSLYHIAVKIQCVFIFSSRAKRATFKGMAHFGQ